MPIQADSMAATGNAVDVRITINPALATSGLNLSASTTNAQAQATNNLFDRWFSNNTMTVSLGQQGSFGQNVRIAAQLAHNFNTSTLVFYSYDRVANTFVQIPAPNVFIDANGYVHFTTALAGDIIISQGALARR
jgi:hypothetical protein